MSELMKFLLESKHRSPIYYWNIVNLTLLPITYVYCRNYCISWSSLLKNDGSASSVHKCKDWCPRNSNTFMSISAKTGAHTAIALSSSMYAIQWEARALHDQRTLSPACLNHSITSSFLRELESFQNTLGQREKVPYTATILMMLSSTLQLVLRMCLILHPWAFAE